MFAYISQLCALINNLDQYLPKFSAKTFHFFLSLAARFSRSNGRFNQERRNGSANGKRRAFKSNSSFLVINRRSSCAPHIILPGDHFFRPRAAPRIQRP